MHTENILGTLQPIAAKLADLDAALALMGWDQEVNMPRGSAARRASQLGTLAGIRHQILTRELQAAVVAAVAHPQLAQQDAHTQRNIRQLHRSVSKATKLPEAFVMQLTETTALAQQAWEQARARNDYVAFSPHLEKIVALKRQEAEYYGYAQHPYDALLDSYEPDATAAHIEAVFAPLRGQLKHLIGQVMALPAPDDSFIQQPVAADKQWQFGLQVLQALGYDFAHGRQDRSAHPFSTSFGMEDVRITTNIDEADATQMLYSCIHECGHALYEQGLNPAHYGLPAAEACSLSIHESQSRIWENNVGRSAAFWQYAYAAFAKLYPDGLKGRSANDVFRAVNKVQPSLVRIYADELTYHYHIILRFELERALIAGELQVADLPAAWNEKMQHYLGLPVYDDSKGVLQDIHWSHGSFGYFPTYSLGSFYAAQLYHFALQDLPLLEGQIAQGQFGALKNWLAEKIYSQGRLYNSEELCQHATGQGLSVSYFLQYMQAKLTHVYQHPISLA